jgi:hypothetical protein
VRVFDPPYFRLCSHPYDTLHAAQSLSDPLMQLTNNSVQGKRPNNKRNARKAHAAADDTAAAAAEEHEVDLDPELMWSASRFARYVRGGICDSVQQEAWDDIGDQHSKEEEEEEEEEEEKEAGGPWETRAFPQIKRLCAATVRSIRDRLVLRKGASNVAASAVTGFEWLGFDFMLDADLNAMLIEVNLDPDMSHSTAVTKHFVPQAVRGALDIVLPRSEEEKSSGLSAERKATLREGNDPRDPQGKWVVVETMM